MISAVKKEKDIWSENDGTDDSDSRYDRERDLEDAALCTAPGTKKSGFLKLGGGEFSLPYTVICGSHPGKTVLITAAVHGGEYVGIQAAVELADKLKPEKIHGRVILVKTVCRKEFEERSGSVCPEDEKNLNRVFPGNPQGTRMDVWRMRWFRSFTVQQIIILIFTAGMIMSSLRLIFTMPDVQMKMWFRCQGRWQSRQMFPIW